MENAFLNIFSHCKILKFQMTSGESPCGKLVNVLNCDIVVSEFKLQSCYYVHFLD